MGAIMITLPWRTRPDGRLLGGALVSLDRRPLIAGILFGLMAYKPQFGLMIPIALAAGGYWRSFSAAAA